MTTSVLVDGKTVEFVSGDIFQIGIETYDSDGEAIDQRPYMVIANGMEEAIAAAKAHAEESIARGVPRLTVKVNAVQRIGVTALAKVPPTVTH